MYCNIYFEIKEHNINSISLNTDVTIVNAVGAGAASEVVSTTLRGNRRRRISPPRMLQRQRNCGSADPGGRECGRRGTARKKILTYIQFIHTITV